jgi:hypothetical protein
MTVVELVERERSRLRLIHAVAWVGTALVVSAATIGAGAWLLGGARWISLPRATPLLVWLVVACANAAVFVWAVRRNRHRLARGAVAAEIEREQALRAGALRGVIEVAGQSAVARRVDRDLSATLVARGDLAPRLRQRGVMRATQAFGVAALTLALLLWAAPALSDGLLAIRRPIDAWRGTLLPTLSFRDLPAELLRGEPLAVAINAPGRRIVTLDVRATGEGWRSTRLAVDSANHVARAELGAVNGDVRVVARDGRVATDTMIVRVTDRPFVGGVVLRATYPAYLSRPSEGLPLGEPARVPQGTVIDVEGRASTMLQRVVIRGSADSVAFATRAHAFSGRFRPTRTDRWSWAAFGSSGAIADVPLPLDITVVPDSAPRVDIAGAATDTVLASADRVALNVTAEDDHGLATIELHSVKVAAGGRAESAALVQRLSQNEGTVWNGTAALDIAARGLGPGDALRIQAVAVDNSPWAQRGVSREIVLRVPTLDERREMARASADSTAQEAVATAAAQRSLEQRTDEASRERGNRDTQRDASSAAARGANDPSRNMSYESAEKARALAQEQRALAQRVEKLKQAAAALQEQLRQAAALDTSLARQLQEAQNLLRDALTPEMLAQMQKLEDASHQLSGDQARDAMHDLAEMQRRLREQLEKSAEMLKRAALEGSMQTLSDQARDLAQREQALADSAQRMTSAQRRDSAQQLAQRSDRLSNDVQRLQDRLAQQRATAAADKTAAAQRHANASTQSMQQQNAQSAAQQMNQAANEMHDAREQQVGAWKQELTSALDESIQELLEMAREESALEQRARAGQDSAAGDDMRSQQSALQQGVDKTGQRLQREGQKSSLLSGRAQRAMTDAQQRVAQATRQVGEQRSGQQTGSSLGEASDALNRAAAALARDRERANSATSATGFAEMLQQMQEMAKRQGSINAQAQGIMPMPGSAMSADAQATARMLAQQQRAIAQQLDELGEAAGGDRAGELAKEARRLADAMEQTHVDANTLARQQQLFRRLLDAGRSLERDDRDDTGKREAHAATGDQRFDPGQQAVNGRSATRFREPTWNELRGLSADERRAIMDYFARINAEKP